MVRGSFTGTIRTMPELLEVEAYRQLLLPTIGARILRVEADNLVCGGLPGRCPAEGQHIVGLRRKGKLLLIDLADLVVGLHARMTGSVLLDGTSAFDKLRYAPKVSNESFIRLRVHLDDGSVIALHDPRRLARVILDPDEDRLGPDATTATAAIVERALAIGTQSEVALKTRLLDQSRLSGLGNLLVDEICFQARLDPARAAARLLRVEIEALAEQIGITLQELGARGGSDRGTLQDARHRGGCCPNCGALLTRSTIGGRTTYACRVEQQ